MYCKSTCSITFVLQITKVITNVTNCVGGAEAMQKLRDEGEQIAFDFVAQDQAEVSL